MAKISVNLVSAEVVEDQGLVEGDPEVRIQVIEGKNNVVWPSLNGYEKINKRGGAKVFSMPVATYEIASGTLSKQFDLVVTEVDSHERTLGRDDFGDGKITFALTPTMTPSTLYTTISLNRENMSAKGKIRVGLKAYRV